MTEGRCGYCGIAGDHPGPPRGVRCCPDCRAEGHDGRPRADHLDRAVADLLGIARWPGLADRIGFKWALTSPRRPGDTRTERWGYVDLDALQAAARRVLPPAAWTARPAWADPEEVAARGRW